MKRVVVITGGSSGIGKATAKYFLDKGFSVYELSRSGVSQDRIVHIDADVTDEASVKRAVEQVAVSEGQIDVLVANAGMGISGAVEYTEAQDFKKIFDVNVFGTVNVINATLPYMRERRQGKIVCVSSVASVVSIPFQTFYSMTKSSVNSLVLGLRNELKPFNVKVCAVMPGDVKTGFTDAREKSTAPAPEYAERVERSVMQMERDERTGMNPKRIAKKIYSLANKRNPKPLSSVGISYKLICTLVKLLPTSLANKIVGMIYAK